MASGYRVRQQRIPPFSSWQEALLGKLDKRTQIWIAHRNVIQHAHFKKKESTVFVWDGTDKNDKLFTSRCKQAGMGTNSYQFKGWRKTPTSLFLRLNSLEHYKHRLRKIEWEIILIYNMTQFLQTNHIHKSSNLLSEIIGFLFCLTSFSKTDHIFIH